jgi:hypothetical protein
MWQSWTTYSMASAGDFKFSPFKSTYGIAGGAYAWG